MQKLTGEQHKKLQNALISAFPSEDALKHMLMYQLSLNLAEIGGSGILSTVVFNVIVWAEAQGRTGELVVAACKEVPGNADLQAFVDHWNQPLKPERMTALRSLLVRIPQESLQLTDITRFCSASLPDSLGALKEDFIALPPDLDTCDTINTINEMLKKLVKLPPELNDYPLFKFLTGLMDYCSLQVKEIRPDVQQWLDAVANDLDIPKEKRLALHKQTHDTNKQPYAFLQVIIGGDEEVLYGDGDNKIYEVQAWLCSDASLQERLPVHTGTVDDFPRIVQDLIGECNKRLGENNNEQKLMIELFLPFTLFHLNVEHWNINLFSHIAARYKRGRPTRLATKYCVTTRLLDRIDPLFDANLKAHWKAKWKTCCPESPMVFVDPDDLEESSLPPAVSNALLKLWQSEQCAWEHLESLEGKLLQEGVIGLGKTCVPPIHVHVEEHYADIFYALLNTDVPVALLVRGGNDNIEEANKMVEEIISQSPLEALPHAVHQRRLRTGQCESSAYHLSLFFDTPERIPPYQKQLDSSINEVQ